MYSLIILKYVQQLEADKKQVGGTREQNNGSQRIVHNVQQFTEFYIVVTYLTPQLFIDFLKKSNLSNRHFDCAIRKQTFPFKAFNRVFS